MEQQEMINEVYIWVLSGVLGFLLLILVFAGKTIAGRVGAKLDELVRATLEQTQQIKQLFKDMDKQQTKIDELKDDLAKVKLNQHSCKHFEPK